MLMRGAFLAAANLTANEWINRQRYYHLLHATAPTPDTLSATHPGDGSSTDGGSKTGSDSSGRHTSAARYCNRFDQGPLRNLFQFWFVDPKTDWGRSSNPGTDRWLSCSARTCQSSRWGVRSDGWISGFHLSPSGRQGRTSGRRMTVVISSRSIRHHCTTRHSKGGCCRGTVQEGQCMGSSSFTSTGRSSSSSRIPGKLPTCPPTHPTPRGMGTSWPKSGSVRLSRQTLDGMTLLEVFRANEAQWP